MTAGTNRMSQTFSSTKLSTTSSGHTPAGPGLWTFDRSHSMVPAGSLSKPAEIPTSADHSHCGSISFL